MNREEGLRRIQTLVAQFKKNITEYSKPSYNETQVRTDFITPFLECLGWDVYNKNGYSLDLREVFEEATVEVGEEKLSKKPDYEIRFARQRKFFFEAKKPSIKIDQDKASAFQIRRYGYSASLPISVLINFKQLIIYDCIPIPRETDEAHVARILVVNLEDFATRFDELWENLSREVVLSGEFDRRYKVSIDRQGYQQFDKYFLEQVRSWRMRLAKEFRINNPLLSSTDLTYAVQIFISRLIFLRICEDRDIEKYETLRKTISTSTFDQLIEILKRADSFYDSGIFNLLSDKPLNLRLGDNVLREIIDELYYPKSPYTFSVVEAEMLGEIYEIFLGEEINVDQSGNVSVAYKPEVRAAGGVIPTPRYLADAIVLRTLSKLVINKSPDDLSELTVADICCGSGIFLLAAYDFLINYYINWYVNNNCEKYKGVKIYEVATGNWKLTYEEKRRILKAHIRGVDIDSNAVEVARFSLLLKLIEDESADTLSSYVKSIREPALPSLDNIIRCGNSLISFKEWRKFNPKSSNAILEKINPFDWDIEFPNEISTGGFSSIIGNPPYIRIQNMVEYSSEEVEFYKNKASPFTTSHTDNFDKYALFIERTITLLKNDGRAGLIIPNKFMTLRSGMAIRKLLAKNSLVDEIVHFGAQQVFGSVASNYTCIIVLEKFPHEEFLFEQVKNVNLWKYNQSSSKYSIKCNQLSDLPWKFSNNAVNEIFDRVMKNSIATLETVADIFVGVQSSADDIYIVKAKCESSNYIEIESNGFSYRLEKEILKPCLHDVTLYSYTQPIANKYIIFPYEIHENKAKLIQPDLLSKNYPGVWKYLNDHKDQLNNRSISGGRQSDQQWYQYGRSQSLVKLSGEKIILPILSLEPRYAIDKNNIFVTGGGNGPYYLIRPKIDSNVSIELLAAILNHPLSEALIRTSTSVFRGGYYSHGKQFIKNLPIPNVTHDEHQEIINLVHELAEFLNEKESLSIPQQHIQQERKIKSIKKVIEEKVSSIFKLDNDDLDSICSVSIPD